MNSRTAVPRGFWVVGIVLLLWAAIGDTSYLAQVTRSVPMDAETARAFDAMPEWLWAVFAVAVWSGTAGAVLLLARRRLAAALFALSLAAVIVQFGYTLGMTDIVAVKGVKEAAGVPLVIFAIGAFQLWWAWACAQRGYLR